MKEKLVQRPRLLPKVAVRTKRDRSLAKVLRMVEGFLWSIAEHRPHDAGPPARLALDAIQPWAIAYNRKADWDSRAPLLKLLAEVDEERRTQSAELVGKFPHWAMYMIGESLAATMSEPPNYMTATMVIGKGDGKRFEVTCRQLGKGKTAHDLRCEAEEKIRHMAKLIRSGKLDEAIDLADAST